MPIVALGFAVAPVAGQNFGARQHQRVRETFNRAVTLGTIVMLLLMVLCQWQAQTLIALFSGEPAVIEVGSEFLRIISWNFVASSIIFTCSSLFQALGNTLPSLLSSATRLLTYALPAVWLASRPGLQIEHVWYISVATMLLQTVISLMLLRVQMRERLSSPAGQQA